MPNCRITVEIEGDEPQVIEMETLQGYFSTGIGPGHDGPGTPGKFTIEVVYDAARQCSCKKCQSL
jgi:hypothetical protein